MADTQILFNGWKGSVAGSVVTPPAPLNFDAGETFLIDVTLGTSFPIVSTVKDSNNLVTSITVTGSPTNGNGFCQALSAASSSNIFTSFGAANTAAEPGDVVMYTPKTRSHSIMNSNLLDTVLTSNVKFRSCTPVWKLYLDVHGGSPTRALQHTNLARLEDVVITAAQFEILVPNGAANNCSIRRSIVSSSAVNVAGASTVLNLENCLMRSARGSEGFDVTASATINIVHCFLFRARVRKTSGTVKMDNTIIVLEVLPFSGLTGDFNWATDSSAGVPGANSLISKDLDDLKIAHSETEVNGFPTGPMFGFFPTPAAVFGFTGDPPTILGTSDEERRDFMGSLRPSSGNQTAGPINLNTNSGGVVWTTYQPDVIVITTPNAPVITSVVAGNAQVTVSITGDAGKTHEVFFFTPGATVPVSGGTRVGDGDIIISGLNNGITIVIEAVTQAASGGPYSPPSLCKSATPVATASAPVGQIPNLIDRIRSFYLNSADFLSWINVFDVGETTADHVTLGYKPTNIKDLLSKGPVALIEVGDHNVVNSGQQTSYDGTLEIMVHHIWSENEDVKDDHMLAYNKMAAIENALLKLSPFDSVFGSAVMTISGDLTGSFDESDEQWIATSIITLDWGPGE